MCAQVQNLQEAVNLHSKKKKKTPLDKEIINKIYFSNVRAELTAPKEGGVSVHREPLTHECILQRVCWCSLSCTAGWWLPTSVRTNPQVNPAIKEFCCYPASPCVCEAVTSRLAGGTQSQR